MRNLIYYILLLCIFCIGVYFRFYEYTNRWGLAYDQAHDVAISRYALHNHLIPLVGPFSSAGAFQTSGVWYWFIMSGIALYPSIFMTPWILLTTMYSLLIIGMVYLGYIYKNKYFGLLLGLLTALSTAQIAQGINLTNQSPLAITSFFVLLSFIQFTRTKRTIWLFFISFFVSLSGSIHLQGVSLIFFILMAFIIHRSSFVKKLFTSLIGIFFAVIPNLLFDIKNSFIHLKSAFHYITVDQYNIPLEVLGRRWKTFLIDFLPVEWSHLIGGHKFIGLFLIFLFITTVFFCALKYKKHTLYLSLSFLLICMFIVVKYTRTPLFSSYLVFLHPVILLISADIIYTLMKKNTVIGALFLFLCVFFSTQKSLTEINGRQNYTHIKTEERKAIIRAYAPNNSFSLFDLQNNTRHISIPLSGYLDVSGNINSTGKAIGIASLFTTSTYSGIPIFRDDTYQILDISTLSAQQRYKEGWSNVNPQSLYENTQYWNNKNK